MEFTQDGPSPVTLRREHPRAGGGKETQVSPPSGQGFADTEVPGEMLPVRLGRTAQGQPGAAGGTESHAGAIQAALHTRPRGIHVDSHASYHAQQLWTTQQPILIHVQYHNLRIWLPLTNQLVMRI